MKKFLFPMFLLFIISSCSDISNINQDEKSVLLSYLKIVPPSKLKYSVGEEFDSTGLSVIAFYTNNTSKEVTEKVIISGFDNSKNTVKQKITISYSEGNITKYSYFYVSIEQTYKIIFNSNNSKDQKIIQNITLSDVEKLSKNSFTYDNLFFYKWNTKSDGSGISYKDSALTSELEFADNQITLELFAQWTQDIPIIISKDNYQTVFQGLENCIGKEYLFYCIDEISSELLEAIKDAIYSLYETKITLDCSSVCCSIFMVFSDRDYSNLISVFLPKRKNNNNYGFRFGSSSTGFFCKNLKSIIIDKNITYIASRAFYGCESLESIVIPDAVSEISEYAFTNCKSLKEISISNNLTHLGSNAFAFCTSLKTVSLGNGFSSIGDSTFDGCTSLDTIKIPESIKSIGYRTFYGCSSLREIDLPDSVTKIGAMAFENCSSLNVVKMGKNISSIDYSLFKDCVNLQTVVLSESISSLPPSIFSGCIKLNNIILPNRLSSIGSDAFKDCSSLEEINIPNRIERLEGYIFKNCSNLKNITIGSGLKYISPQTFIGCNNLSNAIFTVYSDWKIGDSVTISASEFIDTSLIANYLKEIYVYNGWSRIEN